jgi:hypothetical protein
MRCVQAPGDELKLVGWLHAPGSWIWCRVLFFNSVRIRILGQSFEKRQVYTRKPKISHFVEKSHYYGVPIKRLHD